MALAEYYPMEPRVSYSMYPGDQYMEQQMVDPHYAARHMHTRYRRRPVEYRCCEKCVGRLENAVQSLPGVENVLYDEYDEVLKISGSADPDVVHQAVKYARKSNPGHYHYLPKKLHFLSPRRPSIYYDTQYCQNRYNAPNLNSWDQPIQYRTSQYHGPSFNNHPSHFYEDDAASWRYGGGHGDILYGPSSFGYAAHSPYSTPLGFGSRYNSNY